MVVMIRRFEIWNVHGHFGIAKDGSFSAQVVGDALVKSAAGDPQ
jgi:hypothetical protein